MLQLIRGKVGSWFIKILFGLLILSFAVWGVPNLFSSGGPGATVATVGEERISVQRLADAFQAELGRLQQMFGPSLDYQLAINLGLLDQAMERLVNESLFDQAAGRLGVQAPDAVIATEIQSQPLFQDRTGQFSPAQFNQYLRAVGQDEPGYVAVRRREMARRDVIDAIAAGAVVPDTLAEALHRYRNETREISAILIGLETVSEIAPPTEEQIEAYYREHEESYMAPEYRVLRVVSVTPSDIADEVEIDEDDVMAEYEYRLDQYETPEQRAFEQIVVPDEETAARIAEAAGGGSTLADAVVTVAGDDVSVISLELAPRSELLPALAEAGFALSHGAVSAPVRSPFGWHVLKVTEIVAGSTLSYESARPEILEELRLEEAREIVHEVANDIDDLLASDASLDEVSRQLDLPLTVTAPVARDGSLEGGGVLQGLPALPQVLQAGFTLFEGVTGQLQETEDDEYFVVRVERVMAPTLRTVDEVREAIVTAWTAEQTGAAAEALSETTAERLDAGASTADIAAELGAGTIRQADLRRDGANRGSLPESLVGEIFDANVGDVVISPSDNGFVVARVEAVIPAPAPDAATLDDITGDQAGAIADDLLAGFAQSLRQQFDVDVDRAAMAQMFQPQQEQF